MIRVASIGIRSSIVRRSLVTGHSPEGGWLLAAGKQAGILLFHVWPHRQKVGVGRGLLAQLRPLVR